MSKRSLIVTLAVTVFATACSSLNTTKTTKKEKGYSEDLSTYLPEDPIDSSAFLAAQPIEKTPLDSTLDIRTRLDSALARVDTYNNEKTTYVEGLVIQVYAGNNRSEAKDMQLKVLRYFPDSNPKLIFDQPNYKVRLQTFYTHLEAYPVFKSVQSKFPKAILIPTRIPVSSMLETED